MQSTMPRLAEQYAATSIDLIQTGQDFQRGADELRAGRYREAEDAIRLGLDRLAKAVEELPRVEEAA